jgi:hypothetical protein
MPTLPLIFNGKTITATLEAAIKREELYGKARKIVEKDGVELRKGLLTQEGELIPAEELTTIRVDSQGCPFNDPVAQGDDGKEVPLYTSSFKAAREVREIDTGTFPEISVKEVFPLKTSDLPPGVYETEFTYRDSYNLADAVIVIKSKDEGFLLAGEKKTCEGVGPIVNYNFFEEDDEAEEATDEEALDFGA